MFENYYDFSYIYRIIISVRNEVCMYKLGLFKKVVMDNQDSLLTWRQIISTQNISSSLPREKSST